MRQQLLMISSICLLACGAFLLEAAEIDLLKTLESFAKSPKRKRSGLTYKDYLAFYEDNKNGKDAREVSPSHRLLEDFVLNPMSRWRLLKCDDDSMKQAYVNRMEQTFRRFWPSYVEGKPNKNGGEFCASKFPELLQSMSRQSPQEPTLEMWNEAKEEYEALKVKAEEMVKHEDIYAHLIGYESIVNFLQNSEVKFVMENFAGRMDKCKSGKKFKEIIAEYRELIGSR